jgi:hypothetical protein
VRVTVKSHEIIKPLIRDWRRTLSDDPQRRHDLAMLYWSELVRRITEAQGPPTGSVLDDTTDPPTYWCELTGAMWAQFVVMPDKRIGVFNFEREVVVINLATRPPA